MTNFRGWLVLAAMMAGLASAPGGSQEADLLARVWARIDATAAEWIAVRHDLHRHPELSGSEVRTSARIAARLEALGLNVRNAVGGHGVVGVLRGGRPGPLVAYRADMDAMPSVEQDAAPYASEVPGVRHICGHDVHVAVALSLAAALASVRSDLSGSVLFVFQPAEERATGARAMLAAGVFADGKPEAIYALHTSPYEVGQIATRPGVMMPARDSVRVSVSGTGDTATALEKARAVVRGLSTLTPTQTLQPQPEGFAFVDLQPSAPGAAVLQGTVSVAGQAARARVKTGLTSGLGALDIPGVAVTPAYTEKIVPGVTNDPALTARATAALVGALGQPAVIALQTIVPAFSEDFGWFQDEVPGVFFFLGVSRAAKGIVGMPHTPGYVADDDAIAFGARAMAAVLLARLADSPSGLRQ